MSKKFELDLPPKVILSGETCKAQAERTARLGAPGLEVVNPVIRRLPFAKQLKKWRLARRFHSASVPRYLDKMQSQKAVFIRVPKCASTSISHALYGNDPIEFPPHNSVIFYDSVTPLEMDSCLVFATIREPADRLASAFRHYCQNTKHPAENKAISRFMQGNESYDNFLSKLSRVEDLNSLHLFNFHHFRKQADFVCDKSGQIGVDYIILTQSIPSMIGPMETYLGKKIVVDRHNKTVANNPKSERSRKTSLPKNVADFYKIDYEIYNQVLAAEWLNT